MKNCEEVLNRAVAILAFCDRCSLEEEVIEGNVYSVDQRELQRQKICNWLIEKGYVASLTQEEKNIMDTPITNVLDRVIRNKINIYESIEPLLWMIGLSNKLTAYDKYVSKDFHPVLEIGSSHKKYNLLNKCKLKQKEAIIEHREVSMLWYWRSKVAKQPLRGDIDKIIIEIFGDEYKLFVKKIKLSQTTPKDFIAFNKPYFLLTFVEITKLEDIAIWRHHAYEWVLSEENWDDVPIIL